MTGRILVAGVGNIFQRDDAFGVEVIRRLVDWPAPPGVEIADFGTRGVHLAYELLDGCDLLILVDVAARGEIPGTVSLIEVGPGAAAPSRKVPLMDPHGLAPDAVFELVERLGADPGRALVVACEPADVSSGMGLSEPVAAAVPYAVRLVQDVIAREAAGPDAVARAPAS
jgi:hydrogenase maturation protease